METFLKDDKERRLSEKYKQTSRDDRKVENEFLFAIVEK